MGLLTESDDLYDRFLNGLEAGWDTETAFNMAVLESDYIKSNNSIYEKLRQEWTLKWTELLEKYEDVVMSNEEISQRVDRDLRNYEYLRLTEKVSRKDSFDMDQVMDKKEKDTLNQMEEKATKMAVEHFDQNKVVEPIGYQAFARELFMDIIYGEYSINGNFLPTDIHVTHIATAIEHFVRSYAGQVAYQYNKHGNQEAGKKHLDAISRLYPAKVTNRQQRLTEVVGKDTIEVIRGTNRLNRSGAEDRELDE